MTVEVPEESLMTPKGVAVYEKARVLAVDDDREVRALLVRALSRKDIECDVAEDGLAAKAKLAQQNYAVLICDLRMPRYHGHRLVSELLESGDHPEIIVITGVSEPKLFTDLLGRGVSDIMLKPFSYEYMAVKVESLIKRRPAIEFISAKKVAEETYSSIESATASLRDQQNHLHENFQRTLHHLERQRDDLESGYLDSLRVLANLLNQIGKFKSSHASRVEEICTYIAKRMRVSQAEMRDLKVAALLHDLGQFGLSDAIRAKPVWQLTGEERAGFEKYPLLGATLLSEIRGASRVVEYVEGHAENFDGTGFPHGISGHD
ncbi:MAG: response regulator, partial [Candidatus Hydrogenedentes bacterium]|nr:response regulator [Candidatus Hydrogenedentota bacterium]